MITKFRNNILKYNLIQKQDKVIVGVSGGSDSVALMHLLKCMTEEIDFEIIVVHINHKLRGNDSDQDERYVKEICSQYNIKCYSKSIDIEAAAKENKVSIEVAARNARYNYFEEIRKLVTGTKIAVAHNSNDQAETIFMNLIRGTGIDGLVGMEYSKGIIIRPMLNFEKSMIDEYCFLNNLQPRIDKSNFENIYTRNKVRLDLIPSIEKAFGVDFSKSINRMSNIIREDRDFIESVVKTHINDVYFDKANNNLKIFDKNFSNLHKAIQRRLIRKSIEILVNKLTNVENQHIEKILELFESGKVGKEISLPHGIRAVRTYEHLTLTTNNLVKTKQNYKMSINIPGVTVIENIGTVKTYIEKRVKNVEESYKVIYNSLVQKFDYDKIKGELVIRTRQNGDSFKPFKSNGTKKIKKYFIDKKIPREKRDEISVIALESEVLWLVGYQISDNFKVDIDTKEILIIEFTPFSV
jgi:tRNA(Ile)-lysidine synthase